MRIANGIREVFAHFQNLNLLVLIQDLRLDQTARADWSTNSLLCPVAHGLANGAQVHEVNLMGEFAKLAKACDYAAGCLGADAGDVVRFVRSWDDQSISTNLLLRKLEEIWEERLTDAETVQLVLEGPSKSKQMCHASWTSSAEHKLAIS